MRVFISGPMRGLPQFGFPRFDAAADYCRRLGWEVVNPADHDREVYALTGRRIEDDLGYQRGDVSMYANGSFSFADAMLWDLASVAECDAVVLLPGWVSSVGSRLERDFALALRLRVFSFDPTGPSVYGGGRVWQVA